MNWITVRMELKDNQAKVEKICLSKFAIGTVREGQFLYKLIVQVTNTILIATVLSLFIFQSPSLIASFLSYTIFPFHLYSPRVGQMVGVDTCPISTFLKSLGVAVRLKNNVQKSLPY